MNRSRIEWCDLTWNVVTGCTRGCHYCYARRMAYRLRGRYGYDQDKPFRPTFHADRLFEPYHHMRPSIIFTCSMGELFDPKVPPLWTSLVLNVMQFSAWHDFILLTKQVLHMEEYFDANSWIPDNLWLGISDDGLTTDFDAVEYFRTLEFTPRKVVSFEPLLGPINQNLYGLKWVIIGAQTGPGAKPPKPEWVQEIIDEADNWDVPIFLKDNLNWPEKRQEFPQELEVAT